MTGRPKQQSLDFNLVPLVTALLPSGDRTGRKSCSFFQKIIGVAVAQVAEQVSH